MGRIPQSTQHPRPGSQGSRYISPRGPDTFNSPLCARRVGRRRVNMPSTTASTVNASLRTRGGQSHPRDAGNSRRCPGRSLASAAPVRHEGSHSAVKVEVEENCDCHRFFLVGLRPAGRKNRGATLVESLARPGVGRCAMRAWSRRACRRSSSTVGAGRPLGVTVSGRASTLTSALWPQPSHVALTARTPFCRMFAKVIGGPGLLRVMAFLVYHPAGLETLRLLRAKGRCSPLSNRIGSE